MQSPSRLRPVLKTLAASTRRTKAQALASVPPAAAGALMAPLAMAVGALGLAGVWAVAPRPLPDLSSQSSPLQAYAPLSVHTPLVATLLRLGPLGRLLEGLGAPIPLTRPAALTMTQTAAQASAELRAVEAQMITAAHLDAQARLAASQAAFRATGLDARAYLRTQGPVAAPGFSPSELKNPSILAARLDLDTATAREVKRVADELTAARTLGRAAAALPIATPVDTPVRSSPFGERVDPFTGHAAFHPGQDFAGRYGQPIHVTAPGVVSFVGQRTGYGNCVEVDHGYGFKTRYGHLSGFTVGVGTPVKTGDVIGRMGSTGRSTGVHLHYEVWASGRLLNPTPFLKAGKPAPKA